MSAGTQIIEMIGSKETAWPVFKRLYSESPAYRQHIDRLLSGAGKNSIEELSWSEIPVITKSFYQSHPWRELVPRDLYREVYSILRSSGSSSSGKSPGCFWPQLKTRDREQAMLVHKMISDTFSLREKSTLAIVGLSLGSWAGGEQFSFLFKSLAMSPDLRVVVFSPGNQHDEIIEIINECADEFEQLVIAVCPSAIFYLLQLGDERGVRLPLEKISFLVTGEPFPEEMRLKLEERSGKQRLNKMSMLSVYGSADTGLIGAESEPLILMRQFLTNNPQAALKAGFEPGKIPNLYHAYRSDGLIEIIDNELVITQWQGLPLVRYNLEDHARAFSWKRLCELIASHDRSQAQFWTSAEVCSLPDVIAVRGRTKGCIFVCGSNIYEYMLEQALMQSSLWQFSTGLFVVWSGTRDGRQVLHWEIELKPGIEEPTAERLELGRRQLVENVGQLQPEFAEDYERFYKRLETQQLHIFEIKFLQPGTLSGQSASARRIKHRIIVPGRDE